VKDPSINLQDEIHHAVNQLEQHISLAKHSLNSADANVQLFFQQISQLGYAPA
jgi:hypothetical protein